MSDTVATLKASPPRRVIGVGMLAVLGALLLYLAAAEPPAEFVYTIFMVLVGGTALWNARRMWMATGIELQLTEEALTTSDGVVLCRIEDVASIDRGAFAFKPSHGFLIRLKSPHPRGWAPGIWWRFGARIGVGGVTPGPAGKSMADVMTAMLAKRAAKSD